jgi:outer membrane lipase/esterase
VQRLIRVLLVTFISAAAVYASPFTSLVIFGDSLSDNGNAYIGTGGAIPSPPNYTLLPGGLGRFTDGPDTTPAGTAGGLWHEVLATSLGTPVAQPFLAGGTNYAVGGAQVLQDVPSGSQTIPSLASQVGLYLAGHGGVADPNALYVFWGGANDLYNAVETPGETPAQIALTEQQMVTALAADITALAGSGAHNFLWLNLPQLATTPRGALDLLSTPALGPAFAAASTQFASDVAAESMLLAAALGISITDVDVYALYQAIVKNPGAYGYTNVTTPAILNPAANPDQYLFWDIPSHPTTTGHKLIGEAAFAALQSTSVPEPATWTFAGAGLLLAFCYRRFAR